MSNATVSRAGLRQGNADNVELFRDVFAGEVLTAFETKVVLKDRTNSRTITSGKSASFPATWKATAAYHTPGVELVGQSIPHQDVVVTVDDLLVADAFIANIDEAMNYFDVRAPYSKALGESLATAYDKNIARSLILSSRGAALFTADVGGASSTLAGYATSGANILAGIGAAVQAMEEKDVSIDTEQVYAALKPAQFYLVAQTDNALHKDYGGNGVVSKGTLRTLWDVEIVKSNALPFGVDESATGTVLTKYRGNWTNTRGVVFTRDAMATVQLMGMAMESAYDIRRQGTLMLGKFAVGHGKLRTKCSFELKIA